MLAEMHLIFHEVLKSQKRLGLDIITEQYALAVNRKLLCSWLAEDHVDIQGAVDGIKWRGCMFNDKVLNLFRLLFGPYKGMSQRTSWYSGEQHEDDGGEAQLLRSGGILSLFEELFGGGGQI